jgi:hypothetical protein
MIVGVFGGVYFGESQSRMVAGVGDHGSGTTIYVHSHHVE